MSSFPSAFSNSANSYNSKGGHRQELDIFHGLSTREKSESSYQPPGYQAETAIDIESSYTQDNKNKLDFYEPQRQPFNNDIGTDSFNNNNNNINNNSNININNSAPVGTSAQLYGSLSPVPEVQSAADGPEPSVIVGIATRGFSSIKDNIIILGYPSRFVHVTYSTGRIWGDFRYWNIVSSYVFCVFSNVNIFSINFRSAIHEWKFLHNVFFFNI
eukprot:GHVR01161196.1.p2 GENE.GHVR01161196.1~~GHVR01161196.1.p2  ORF type:complete len:229 (+),score=49.56 GHVR01161196.1:44-688(+)